MEKQEKNIISLQPLFSVLIANYNNGKYLMDAVESVRKQTYTNWEIILVDDCSTDNSKELYGELEQDKRIHVYYNDCNHGCGHTKRRCAELATGEICGFLDPDDAITEDALEIMVEAHYEHPTASLVNSTYYVTDSELNITSVSETQCQIPPDTSFLEYGNGISHFATYKNKSYLQTIGIDKNMLRAVDHDLYFKIEEVGDVYYIDQPLYFYRCGTGQNISLGGKNQQMALWWDVYAIANACMRRNLSVEKFAFSIITKEIDNAYISGQELILQTKAYRWGSNILRFLRRIKKIIVFWR